MDGLVHGIGDVTKDTKKHVSPDLVGAGIAHGIAAASDDASLQQIRETMQTLQTTIQTISEELEEVKLKAGESAPPIGTWIYADYDPSEQWPGTSWIRVDQGRFLIAAGSTYVAGRSYGANTHTLTINEMPSHNHQLRQATYANRSLGLNIGGSYLGDCVVIGSQVGTNTSGNNGTVFTGSGAAHNNIPLSTAVPLWHRTA